MEVTVVEVATRLDVATAGTRVLSHPFYQAWNAGTLTREDLAFYAAQYWHHVEAFPGYLADLADRLPDSTARSIVLENLADERGDDHPGLWLRFASALGVTTGEIDAAEVEPKTTACINSFSSIMNEAPAATALGMLYGYESQTPEVAATKIHGLRNHYDITDGLDYFELHAELDIEHSEQLAAAIAELDGESSLAEAAHGARVGALAVWGLLDGVSRARGI